MTSEVREAAGRLRRVQAGEPLSDVYPDWKCETVWPYAADLKLLAYEHLAEHVDDDEWIAQAAEYKLRPCSCESPDVHWIGPPSLFGVECRHCAVSVSGFEFRSAAALAWNLICDIEAKYPDGIRQENIPLQPSDHDQPKSRSVLRREAAQRGEEPPDFSQEQGK